MQLPTRKLISNNSWAIPLSACTNLSLPPRPPERLASGFVTKGRVVLVHRCYRVRRKGENPCVGGSIPSLSTQKGQFWRLVAQTVYKMCTAILVGGVA